MKIKKERILWAACMAGVMLLTAACGKSKESSVVVGKYYYPTQEETQATTEISTEEEAEQPKIGTDAFLITGIDMQSECIILEQLASGKQYMYNYSIVTQFLDKYGNRTNVTEFEPGRIITVGKKDIQGRLLQAQLSDTVWEYPNVTRYSVDEEHGIFTIADTKYSYDEDVFVHSDGVLIKLTDLTNLDTLRVVGIGKKILSVSVTTGHGELCLTNTALFEGSFIQIGNRIFTEITPDMKIEVPEGSYTVAVANNGYGGSTEIEIKRGQDTMLDLDTLKGEGPKIGNILFAVDVAGAILQIDGQTVDYSQEVPVQYGVHTLTVSADSYDTYSKKLFVNSEKATIVIGLTGETNEATAKGDTTAEADSQTEDEQDAGSLAGSLAGSHSTDTSTGQSASNATSEAELNALVNSLLEDGEKSDNTDYLSTLTQLLKTITNEE